jgi:Flp pilus assembly protein TadG
MNRLISRLKTGASPKGFLGRLRSDIAGNTLAMVAAGTIPLVGMIGAGVDISRTYLVKSRLQQACDAGALAGRKFMAGGGWNTNTAAQAQHYFANNFPAGAFGTSNIVFTPGVDSLGQVSGTATATVPVTVMSVFGNTATNLSVSCNAKLEISNTDVMFVLDTTGSMRDCPDGSTCNAGAGSKIVGLRSAVVSFYNVLAANANPTTQNRFGFVPYTMSVNVGGVLPSSYIVDTWSYQSRAANMTTPYYTFTSYGSPTTLSKESSASSLSQSNCASWGTNNNDPVVITGGTPPGNVTTITYSNNATNSGDWGWSGAPDTGGSTRSCRRNRVQRTAVAVLTGYRFANWTYGPTSYDVSAYKAGTATSIATGAPTGYVTTSGRYNLMQLADSATAATNDVAYSWTGVDQCVEERDTLQQATFPTIPSGAYDLDIDTIPSNQATKWRPSFENLVYDRNTYAAETTSNDYANVYGQCPAAAKKLATMTQSQVQTYVNALVADGNTYHDLGMAWGARLISPTGLFASENATAPNGKPINRHIVFMTDGEMYTPPDVYSSHGYESFDQRVGPQGSSTSTLASRHNERYVALCRAARAKNITVWVVAFGTALNTQMTACADPGHAFQANDTATLTTQFQQIASRIADLRLTQ